MATARRSPPRRGTPMASSTPVPPGQEHAHPRNGLRSRALQCRVRPRAAAAYPPRLQCGRPVALVAAHVSARSSTSSTSRGQVHAHPWKSRTPTHAHLCACE
eukprot:scaffold141986_cov29-Tisochrysis_lutea.AAC.14